MPPTPDGPRDGPPDGPPEGPLDGPDGLPGGEVEIPFGVGFGAHFRLSQGGILGGSIGPNGFSRCPEGGGQGVLGGSGSIGVSIGECASRING